MCLVHNDKYLSVMIINEAKLYDTEYVENVLGIRIPLQESVFGYSSEFRARILKEHLLYEGFIDTLKQAAGLVVNTANQAVGAAGQAVTNAVQSGVQKVQQFTDKVKNLAKALYGVMTDGGLLAGYLSILKKRLTEVTKPLRTLFTSLDKFFNDETLAKLLAKFPKFKAAIDTIKPIYEKAKSIVWGKLLNPIDKLTGWAGALAGSTIYVCIQWMRSKVGEELEKNELIQNINKVLTFLANPKEAVKDDIVGSVVDNIKTILEDIGKKVLTEALNTVVGSAVKGAYNAFAPWISAIGNVVGGVDWVATALAPITNTYAERVTAGQQAAPQPGTVDLRRTIAASGQASTVFGNKPAPQPAPVREHIDVATLLAYLND
jgi:hypothetical protein